jgi:hypothetical protein
MLTLIDRIRTPITQGKEKIKPRTLELKCSYNASIMFVNPTENNTANINE